MGGRPGSERSFRIVPFNAVPTMAVRDLWHNQSVITMETSGKQGLYLEFSADA